MKKCGIIRLVSFYELYFVIKHTFTTVFTSDHKTDLTLILLPMLKTLELPYQYSFTCN